MTLLSIVIIYLNSKLFCRPILPFKTLNIIFGVKINTCNIKVLYVVLNNFFGTT